MRRNGYDSYHGRSRVRTFLKVLIVLLLVVLAVAVGALLWLEPYIDYSANGIKINLPFSSRRSRRLLRRPGGGDHAGAHTHTGTGGGLPGDSAAQFRPL